MQILSWLYIDQLSKKDFEFACDGAIVNKRNIKGILVCIAMDITSVRKTPL